MYGTNIQCVACRKDFGGKENQIRCPHCHKLLPPEDIQVTDLGTGLKYIAAYSGNEALAQRNQVASMLSDVLYNAREDVQFVRIMYQAAETEIAAFVKTASGKGGTEKSIKALVDSLCGAYLDPIWVDKGVSALIDAYDLDPDSLLGGRNHPFASVEHHFHKDEFTNALKNLQDSQGKNVWKNTDIAAASILDINPRLKEEACLLKRVGLAGGKILCELMDVVNSASYAREDEKKTVARLQNALLEAFMDARAIDFFMESVLDMAGIPYTQQVYHVSTFSVTTVNPNRFARPRKQRGQGGSGQGTARNSTGSQSTAGSNTGGKSQVSQNQSSHGTGTQTDPVWKKAFVFSKVVIFAVLVIIGVKIMLPMTGKLSKDGKEEAETSVEETIPEETSLEETASPEPRDPYPSPSVTTSVRQGGIYQLGNIVERNGYGEYQGPDNTFYFKYPRVLYDKVEYFFENDGKDIDILFSCEEDLSALSVSTHPMSEEKTPEALKEEILAQAKESMTGIEIVSQRQIMSGSLADTRAETGCAFYVRGWDGDASCQHWIYRITSDTVESMKLVIPEAIDETDRAYKEFYAESIYSQCAFGGNTAPPSWSEFKKNYGL